MKHQVFIKRILFGKTEWDSVGEFDAESEEEAIDKAISSKKNKLSKENLVDMKAEKV